MLKASERPPHLSQRERKVCGVATTAAARATTGGACARAVDTGRNGGGLPRTSGATVLPPPDKEILSVGLFLTKAGC